MHNGKIKDTEKTNDKDKIKEFWSVPEVIEVFNSLFGSENVFQVKQQPGRGWYTPTLILNLYGQGFFVFISVTSPRIAPEKQRFIETFDYAAFVHVYNKSVEGAKELIKDIVLNKIKGKNQ